MPSITFTAPTLRELSQQIIDFVGATPAPAAPPAQTQWPKPDSLALPAWAPAGSKWQPMPGAPVLLGPDGAAIPVLWQGGNALPGAVVHNRDPAAEAAGAALLASLRG